MFEVKCWLHEKVDVAWTSDDEGGVHDHYVRRWVFLLLVGLLALSAVSCAPSRQRCERAYGLCGQAYTDTILQTRVDTITIKGDTLPPQTFDPWAMNVFDTLHFNEGRFKARIFRDTITHTVRLPGDTLWRTQHDTVYRIAGNCDPDTLYRIDSSYIQKVNRVLLRPPDKDRGGNLWANIGWIVLGAVVCAMAIIFIRKLT